MAAPQGKILVAVIAGISSCHCIPSPGLCSVSRTVILVVKIIGRCYVPQGIVSPDPIGRGDVKRFYSGVPAERQD